MTCVQRIIRIRCGTHYLTTKVSSVLVRFVLRRPRHPCCHCNPNYNHRLAQLQHHLRRNSDINSKEEAAMSCCKLGTILSAHPTTIAISTLNARQRNHNVLNMADRELLIQSAIADLDAGIFTSQRQACRAYNIPESTLRGRRAGQQRHAIAHQQQQRLTPEQE